MGCLADTVRASLVSRRISEGYSVFLRRQIATRGNVIYLSAFIANISNGSRSLQANATRSVSACAVKYGLLRCRRQIAARGKVVNLGLGVTYVICGRSRATGG